MLASIASLRSRIISEQRAAQINADDDLPVIGIPSPLKKYAPTVDERLPHPPFFLSVIAQRNSGKTNAVVDALLDPKKFAGRFNFIILWSATYTTDSKFSLLGLPDYCIFKTYEEEKLKEVVKLIEEMNKSWSDLHFCLIFDDLIAAGLMNPHKMKELDHLAVAGRHLNISVIFISQVFMALSPPVRTNTTNWMIFSIDNARELERISQECCGAMRPRDFIDYVYTPATSKMYNFLHIHNNREISKRFNHNWGRVITPTIPDKNKTRKRDRAQFDSTDDDTSDFLSVV